MARGGSEALLGRCLRFDILGEIYWRSRRAVVAEGAVKPTSVLSVTRVEQSLQVIAHLSEGIPRFWLLDSTALEDFVDAELRYGLGVALEAKVLSDINGTSGIQSQTYSTSMIQTVRRAITKIETRGLSPPQVS